MNNRFTFLLCVVCFFTLTATAQVKTDTLNLSLPETEKIFLEKNLSLLASKYGINADKALIDQAKLWDNTTLITDENVYA